MMNTFEALSNPLDSDKAETLERLFSVIGSMKVVFLGAFARDLIFYHINGIEAPRATMDIDICVQMSSWDDFNAACKELRAIGFSDDGPEHPEKLRDINGQEIDLLPFGSLSEDGRTITWPTDDSPWTILGIQEAHDHAWQVRIDGMNLRVIPPCGMIYLKMLSIYDRPDARRKKDTQDINYVLKHYLNVTERDRLRSNGSDSDLMEKCRGDLELAAARLAGRDIGGIISDETSRELSEILHKEATSRSRCPIAHTLASHYRGSFQRSREVLKNILEGLSDIRH